MSVAPPNRPRADLVQRVQECYDSLRPSERIVAKHLRAQAGTRLDLSITELARLLGVSEATVSRVSRALGYSGFSDLKLSVAEGVAPRGADFVNIPAEIDRTDTIIANSSRLASLLCASIQGTQRMLDSAPLEASIEAIRAASRIILVGVGGAAAICQEAAHLLMKAGVDVTSHSDAYMQIVAASNMKAGEVIIGISHTGATQIVASALKLARANGAHAIAITSDETSPVAQEAEITLTTWNSGEPSVPLHGDFLEGRISQLFLVDLLYIGLLFGDGDGDDHARHLEMSADALQRYFNIGGANDPDPA